MEVGMFCGSHEGYGALAFPRSSSNGLSRGVLAGVISCVAMLAACDAGEQSGAEEPNCLSARAQVLSVCCSGGPGHPDFPGPGASSSVSYRDCITQEDVAIPCVDTSGLPPVGQEVAAPDQEQEFDGGAITDDDPCQLALTDAAQLCDGFDPQGEIDCGVQDSRGVALPSCRYIQGMVDALDCEPVNLTEWQPLDPKQVSDLYDQLHPDPDKIAMSDPPPEASYDDGAEVPPSAELLVGLDPNELVDVARLEIPGNFLRYLTRIGPLQYALGKIDEIDGFDCDPALLTCAINPLALLDLTQNPPNGALVFEMVPTGDGMSAGIRLQNFRWTPITDPVVLQAHWDGFVDLTLSSPVEVNLGSPTRLSLLPTHHPSDGTADGYDLSRLQHPDRVHSYLDKALLLTKLDSATCQELHTVPSYLTYETPRLCRCPENASQLGYCVVDYYPRARTDADIVRFVEETGEAYNVKCGDELWIEPYPVRERPSWGQFLGFDLDLTNLSIEERLATFLADGIHGTMPAHWVETDIRDFGCSGRLSRYLMVGPQTPVPVNERIASSGWKVTSAAGLELDTTVLLGELNAHVTSGRLTFTMELGVWFEEWLKKRVPSFLAWIIKWILKVLNGVVMVDVGLDFPPPGALFNEASVRLDPLDVRLHALLSHIEELQSGQLRQGFSAGMRRISTSEPHLDPGNWDLDVTWDNRHCDNLIGSASLVDKFKALIGCPIELIGNVAGLVTQPMQTFLLKQLLEMTVHVTSSINGAMIETVVSEVSRLENGNIVATMLHDAFASFVFEPAWVMNVPLPPLVEDLPPVFAHTCALAPNPSLACSLLRLLQGEGMLNVDLAAELDRVGAKTHYRSMDDFEGVDYTDAFPPVRYCVVGDQPPGAADFDEIGRRISQDFEEVDTTPTDPYDWRNQCAVFADFSPRATGTIETSGDAYRVGLWLSRRTVTLINEIFVCRNSAHCHPASPFIGQRAELAMCSLMGDIWAHPGGSNVPYLNLLNALEDASTDPDIVAVIEEIWNNVRGLMNHEEAENAFEVLAQAATDCMDKLTAAGFPPPPASLPPTMFE